MGYHIPKTKVLKTIHGSIDVSKGSLANPHNHVDGSHIEVHELKRKKHEDD